MRGNTSAALGAMVLGWLMCFPAFSQPAARVVVDGWFNTQKRKTPEGREELFHYKFSDDANSGYSMWGRMFHQYGMRTDMLDHAPRAPYAASGTVMATSRVTRTQRAKCRRASGETGNEGKETMADSSVRAI